MISLFIEGFPRPQARPRLSKFGAYSPKTEWHDKVYVEAFNIKPTNPYAVPVYLELEFLFTPPTKKLAGMWHIKRPDLDNFLKGVMDCITKAGWWTDDSLVCDLVARKRYSRDGEKQGVYIFCRELLDGKKFRNHPDFGKIPKECGR